MQLLADLMASPNRTEVPRLAGVFCAFHGTSPKVAPVIVRNGFVNIKRNDDDLGFFGSGIYTTFQASYALRYANGTISSDKPTVLEPLT